MDMFLIVSAVILLVFGGLLLMAPNVVKKISDFLNTSILPVEDKMRAAHTMSGIILVVLSVIVFYMAFKK